VDEAIKLMWHNKNIFRIMITSCEKSDFDSYDPKVYCIVLLCEIFILKNPIYVSKIEISRFFKSSSSERINYKHIVVILHVLFF